MLEGSVFLYYTISFCTRRSFGTVFGAWVALDSTLYSTTEHSRKDGWETTIPLRTQDQLEVSKTRSVRGGDVTNNNPYI